MSNKYIIKNCPSFCRDICSADDTDCFCCNETNCVMKCIKSKLDYLKCYINNDNSANLSKMNEIIDSTVQLLEIQEAE